MSAYAATEFPRKGTVLLSPYGDGPHSPVSVAQSIYLNIIHSAVDYVHIMTPLSGLR